MMYGADVMMIHALNSNVSDHIAIVTGPAWELRFELTLQVWWSVSRSFEVREPYSYEVVKMPARRTVKVIRVLHYLAFSQDENQCEGASCAG